MGDRQRVLRINTDSRFFNGLRELALEDKIFSSLERYADFEFRIDYDDWTVSFLREVQRGEVRETVDHIKVSRGEENIFIWCVFLAVAELAVDGDQAYSWVKYLYIDDPISSLDDNNTITIASDLAKLLRRGKGRVKTVVSSHHSLFFNVMHNKLKMKKQQTKAYFLHKAKDGESYTLRATNDTPFFHHVAMLSELQMASQTGGLYTHHFNMLRSILEKTANFFGYENFSDCLTTSGDERLHTRALNLLSHGKYSLYQPREMVEDNKKLFKEILDDFLARYAFALPNLKAPATQPAPTSTP